MAFGLEDEKTRLAEKKKRIDALERKMKERERKREIKELIGLGELLKTSGLSTLENQALLGALLEIKILAAQEGNIEKWKVSGMAALENRSLSDGQRLVISFGKELESEEKKTIREMGFVWNRFRKEWNGYGNRAALEGHFKRYLPKIESLD